METYPIDDTIRSFASCFQNAGFSLYIVGGCVRDHLLHLDSDDQDFCTDAEPHEVMSLFRRVIPTGIEHGTVTVLFMGNQFEVTTFRSEGAYSDARHPDDVTFVRSLEKDLERRDFTINAFAADCNDGKIIDLHGGYDDLKQKVIRAIGDPRERFKEDALRILRALRFASKLDFDIEEATFSAMKELRGNLVHVSKERIHEELVKLVSSDHPAKGLFLMDQSGVMDVLFPTLAEGREVMQNGMHDDTVLHHNILCCQAAADHHYPLYVRLAALFHDIGKSRTVVYNDEANTYYHHEVVGATMTRDILRDLKASNDEIDAVSHLVEEHMFHYQSVWSDAAVRRFIRRVGQENIDNLFRLHFADEESICGKADYATVEELDNRIKGILQNNDALSLKELKVNGHDIASLGVKGAMIGQTLHALLETVIDDPKQNTKETLMKIAKAYVEELSSKCSMPKLS